MLLCLNTILKEVETIQALKNVFALHFKVILKE